MTGSNEYKKKKESGKGTEVTGKGTLFLIMASLLR